MNAFHLFSRFGVELEYMIVDAETLDVHPSADELLKAESGSYDEDVKRGPVEWSNELALHVIELKTARPVTRLAGLDGKFHKDVQYINRQLASRGLRLLPGGMHPWMNPGREGRVWPHAYQEVYETFNRIFDCRRHGWMNLQSTHLNLPFADDEEFARLHAGIRVLLPLIPALGASSPFIEGRAAENLDQRLEVYRSNCSRIPSLTGKVIPEALRTRRDYEEIIFSRIYRDLEPHDPDGILRDEWVNARGAIARFSRNTIEIRLLDMQECPAADVAIVECLVAALTHLVCHGSLEAQFKVSMRSLESLLLRTIRSAGAAWIGSSDHLRALGIRTASRMRVSDVWAELMNRSAGTKCGWQPIIRHILHQGTLAERLRRAAGDRPTRRKLRSVYGQLADCLKENTLFHG